MALLVFAAREGDLALVEQYLLFLAGIVGYLKCPFSLCTCKCAFLLTAPAETRTQTGTDNLAGLSYLFTFHFLCVYAESESDRSIGI